MTSIRRQLLLSLIVMLVAALAIAAVGLYAKIREEAKQLFDYQLAQTAFSLRDQVLAQAAPSLSDDPQFDLVIQIWGPTGERAYLSHPHSAIPNRAVLGFETMVTQEGAWRVFGVQMNERIIQVAQPLRVRQQLAQTLAMRTLLPFALLLPVIGVLLWVIVGWGLRPLNRVAKDVATRSASALAPLPEAGLPREVLPLVQALNDLLGRLAHSIDAQRALAGDAAHELRSPLTAVQLQLQLAERAKTETERNAAFDLLKGGISRAIHMANQLLTLARQEPDVMARPFEPVDLNRLVKEVIGDQAPMADAKDIDLGLSRDEPVSIMGDSEALATLLSNLIENAIRHIPNGGKIDVAVSRDAAGPLLSVTDNGPGIPPEERERVLDRFYRRTGSNGPGSGLGLAIVKNIAQRHHAELSLSEGDSGVGLRVTVRFPTPSAEAGNDRTLPVSR